jgi:hypothetical protein
MVTRSRRHGFPLLGIVAGAAVGSIVVLEVLLRILGIDSGRSTPPIYVKSANEDVSYELLPNLNETAFRANVTTDRRGFRSTEVHPAKPTIAVMGDAIAFGYGLENTDALSSKIKNILGEGYNVVNAGVPGYTIGQEAAFYDEKVSLLHPGTVVLIFNWDDLSEIEPWVLDDRGILQPPGWKPGDPACRQNVGGMLTAIPGSCWLDLHSAIFRTIEKIAGVNDGSGVQKDETGGSISNAFGEKITPEQLKDYQTSLETFADSLPRETKKLFVIWPSSQLHLMTTPILRDIAEKAGFESLNLYEVFGNKAGTLEWNSSYPNAKTVEEASTVIKAALTEWELLPLAPVAGED